MESILSENEVVRFLKDYLESNSHVCICKTGYQHGLDIDARKENKIILIEAKGAKANKYEKTINSKVFSKNQIRTHLAVAILKAMNIKRLNKKADVGIAHPSTKRIREFVEPILPFLRKLSIKHYWVYNDGKVEIE